MKTTFKRILTVILALCLLTTSAVCLMGISTSAETPDDSTVVYSYTTTGTGTTFYLQSANKNITATGTGGQSVRYSFDYYVPSSTTGYFTAKNNNGSFLAGNGAANPFDGVVNESTTGSSYLAEGTIGHLDVTLTAQAGSSRTLYAGIGGATGTVYIWNPKVWVNGAEVTVSGLGGGTATTYGEVEFEEGTFDEISPASPAFTWTSAVKAQGSSLQGTFGGGSAYTGAGWGGNGYISSALAAENSYIRMTFDYYNEAADDVFALSNPSKGYSPLYVDVATNTNPGKSGSDEIFLGTGYGSVDFKAINYNAANIYAGINATKDAETGKTLYIWNVKYYIYLDGETNGTYVYPTAFSSVTATTYGAIKDIVTPPDPEDGTPANTQVFKWDFASTGDTNYLQSNGVSIKATGTGGHSVRYSFDYYVPSSTTGYFTARNSNSYFLAGAGAANPVDSVVLESTTGSSYLAEGTIGHIDVSYTAQEGSTRDLYTGIGGATGTVYIWNPKAWVDGNEVTVTGVSGTSTTTTYGEVEFEEGTFDEVSPASPAFTYTSAVKNVGLSLKGTFGGGSVYTGHGWGANANISNTLAAENAYIKMSFDYYNEAADDVFVVSNPSKGNAPQYVDVISNTNPGNSGDSRYLGTGFGSVEFKAIKYSDANIYAGINVAKDAETGKTLYFWNVKYEIYYDGETNRTNVYPTAFSTESTATTYGAISSVLEEGMKAFPVTEWAPADTTDTLTFIGANRSDIVIDAAKNDTITISYDYYTTDARYYRSTFNGTDFYGMQLPSGRNQFEQTVTVTADGEVIPTFEITTTESAAADEFIRLWNVKITHNDTEIEAYPVIANGSGTLKKLTFDDTTEYDENKTDYMVMLDMRGVSEDVLSEIEGSKVMSIVYAPARTTDTDTVSISFDYFVSGEASYIRNAYNADGNGQYGNIASGSQVLNPDAGFGSMSHTSAADNSFAAGVGVGPCPSALFSSTKYANFFYTWDVVLTSENCGTLRYIQQFDLVKTYCESNYITPYAEEMEYDEAEFTNEAKYVVKGDVNSDDVADICDLVYLAIDTNTIFKDYRTFDGDDDYTVKSAEDYDVVRDGIYSFEY